MVVTAAPSSAPRRNRRRGSRRSPRAGRIELVMPYQLHGLEGAGGRLAAVIVADLEGRTRRLEADVLLPFFGLAMNLGPIARWGLALERHHIAVEPADLHDLGAAASSPSATSRHIRASSSSSCRASPRRRWPPTPSTRWSIPARRCTSNTRRPRACRDELRLNPRAERSAGASAAVVEPAGDGGAAARARFELDACRHAAR